MTSVIKKGLLSMSVLFATTITFNTVHAAENTANQKGTMGYGYQKYIEKHPEEKNNETQESSFRSNASTTASGERVLDISEWQGKLSAQQVKDLKANYDFIIIRAQYGSEKVDAALEHNSNLLDKYNLDFGVYSYSMYENP